MAIYKRGYQRYDGPRTPHFGRIAVLARDAWHRATAQRLVAVLLAASCLWPLLCLLFIYIANHAELWAGLDRGFASLLAIDHQFVLTFMKVQAVFSVILAALAGPGLVSPDLANQGLSLYFSRPISRFEYAAARIAALAGLLSLVTWLPGLVLFVVQVSMAAPSWLAANWRLGAGLVLGFWLWILLVSLAAVASSAYVRWRLIAGALVLGYFFVLSGVGAVVNAIFRVEWGDLINPLRAAYGVWCALVGAPMPSGLTLPMSLTALALMAGLLGWVVERRLRPVEVVA